MSTKAPQIASRARPLEESADVLFPGWQYRPLRPGPGRSSGEVAADQRARLQRAVIELVVEEGHGSLTLRRLAKRAQISSGALYRHYPSIDECFLSTYDLTCRRVAERMMEAGRAARAPRERVTLAVERLFRDVRAAPDVATFVLRSGPAAGPVFIETLRASALQVGVALEHCLRSEGDPPLPRPLMEGVVAGLARTARVSVPRASGLRLRPLVVESARWVLGAYETRALVLGNETIAAPEQLPEDPPPLTRGDREGMILAATIRVARTGHHHLTVSRICREAGISRRSFGSHFSCLEECFSSALEHHAVSRLRARRDRHLARWSGSVRRAAETIKVMVGGDRDDGRLLLVEIFAGGTPGIDSRDRLITQIAQVVRSTAPPDRRPSELEVEASTAAAWTILAVQSNPRTAPKRQS